MPQGHVGQELLNPRIGMSHDDVIGQLARDMRSFLAESAFVHAYAVTARLDLPATPGTVVLDLASRVRRHRLHELGRVAARQAL